jgi:hypothetical protein
MRPLVATVLIGLLLACGGVAVDQSSPEDEVRPLPTPVEAPEAPAPAEPEPVPEVGERLLGYGYVAGPPVQFTTFNPGDEVFVGDDGIRLRDEADREKVLAELSHGERAVIMETLETATERGHTNAWVRVQAGGTKGVVFGADLTSIGGTGIAETSGEVRWTVTFSRDFDPVVRVTDEKGNTSSHELKVTERFRGGTVQAEFSGYGDFEGRIDLTLCQVGDDIVKPRCATGSVVTDGRGLTALTVPDAHLSAPKTLSRGGSCDEPPLAVTVDPTPETLHTATMPSYMRGPSTEIPCKQLGSVNGGTHDGQSVVACVTDTGGKGEPAVQLTSWYLASDDDGPWTRLPCMGPVDGELEQHLGYQGIAVHHTLERILGGKLAPMPEILHQTPRGVVTNGVRRPMTLPANTDKVFDHPTFGPVHRPRKPEWGAWGLLVPLPEGGMIQYEWMPNLTDLVVDGETVTTTYRTKGWEKDFFATGVKKVDLTEVGTAGGAPVYRLREDHPFHVALVEQHTATNAHQPAPPELPADPWLFVDGPFGGFYAIVHEDVRFPMMAEPILYAYAEEPTDLSIRFGPALRVRATHPSTDVGWDVRVLGDGLLEVDERPIDRLFWDGTSVRFPAPERGWMVRGDDLEDFLQETLVELGLRGREVDEAIEAWLPSVAGAPWVRVGLFPRKTIDDVAPLTFDPVPDALLRVMVELTPMDMPVPVDPPVIEPFERNGLTVVEWGYVLR